MIIGDVLELTIIDDNHLGNGIAKIKDMPVFIRGGIKGDIVEVEITEVYKKYVVGRIINFINKEKRNEILCPYYETCGGCDLLHISYEKEQSLKKKYIEKLFKDYDVKINTFNRYSYRNKITLHVKDNNIGLYKKNTNDIVPIKKCLLVSDMVNKLILDLQGIDLSSVSEITIREGNGLLLSVIGHISNNDIKRILNNSNIISIYENGKLIYGSKYLSINFNNYTFYVNNNSFLQINTDCAINLYDKIREYVNKSNNLLDLYCGSATIGIYLSDICNKITGVEINKESVMCGKKNIKENNISNYNLFLGDAKDIEGEFDTIVLDPPRGGISKKVIDYINSCNCSKLIYVSCNPNTLKRDLDLLNYALEEITVFNMFPATEHIECVCKLIRRN